LVSHRHHFADSIFSTGNYLFNKNILIAAITSIIANVIIVNISPQITSNSIVISIVSMITDYVVYLVIFASMSLIENRKNYIDPETSKKGSIRFLEVM
jgi:hypothetical protein